MLAVDKQGMVLERMKEVRGDEVDVGVQYVLRTDQVSSAISNDVGVQI